MSGGANTKDAGSPKCFELLAWTSAATALPSTDLTVMAWDGQIIFQAYWDGDFGHWISCDSGANAEGVTHWAESRGPGEPLPGAPAETDIDQVRAALRESLCLLAGWIELRCPKQHQAEHLAALAAMARAGGL